MENLKPLNDIASFKELMPFRISRVLLIASAYDSFMLSDDESLNETFFGQIQSVSSSSKAVIERARNDEEALELLAGREFDLVISMIQVGETNMDDFVSAIRSRAPKTPLVLLSFNTQDLTGISPYVRENSQGIFLWQGDTGIFSAILNLIEDEANFISDSMYGIQAVLLVEDNVKFYSMYLPIIYSELMKQTQIVMSDELNPSKKNLRLKARPKILLKTSYESAWEIYEKRRENLLGVISDIEYPKGGECSKEAGLVLASKIKSLTPDMPVLLQSSNSAYAQSAQSIGASFINKNSSDLSRQIRGFIQRYFGFGDFVFSDESGNEIARAGDLQSMLKVLKTVPASSIVYHASRNHFSKWLLARTEFQIAYNLRPKNISEFKNAEEIRKYLIETIHQFIYKTQLGSVLKFDKRLYDSDTPFAKIGGGSIGGKARGLAFSDYLISKGVIPEKIGGVEIATPNSIVVSTDVFDFFAENNSINAVISEDFSDEKIADIFSKIKLPDYALKDLACALEKMDFPLAVRSSSMLEDSKTHPFAGIYKTYMLKNNSSSFSQRLSALETAIKYIYASVFSKEARSFRKIAANVPDEEKMAVVIQKVVGREYLPGMYFPLVSGVLQSYNFYPVAPLKSENPVAHICCGLGEAVVSGRNALRYSPDFPGNIHQFATAEDTLKHSQKEFIYLDLKSGNEQFSYGGQAFLKSEDVSALEKSACLSMIASYYVIEEERFFDSFRENSLPAVTFAPIIKNGALPLNEILSSLSSICSKAVGANIEMEFALDWDMESKKSVFNILQIRPMTAKSHFKKVSLENPAGKRVVFSSRALGNGVFSKIRDIVFVKRSDFTNLKTQDIAEQIGRINEKLKLENREYILIGPGRWGTSDIHLGIPVKWNDISMAKVIIEAAYGDFKVDPSHGTHFFHNVTSLGLGYFSALSDSDFIDWDFMEKSSPADESEYVAHLSIEREIEARIDGVKGHGAIYVI